MGIIKRIFLLISLIILSISAKANLGGYHYSSIHVEAVVNSDNSWDITETEDVIFDESRHGVYRYIPYYFTVGPSRIGSKIQCKKYECKIDNVYVDGWNYITEYENDNLVIRIGDADRYVTGSQKYVIHYKLTFPEDRIPDADFIYINILGADMPELIDEFSFNITFHKKLPEDAAETLKSFSGKYGNGGNAIPTEIAVEGNRIYGHAKAVPANNAITLFLPLEQGFFPDAVPTNKLLHYISLGVTLLLIIYLLFRALTIRSPHITKSIEFYPPEGICSAEIGTIIDGSVDLVDVTSLIPWLAGKGYIRIEEKDDGGTFMSAIGLGRRKTKLQLTKIKDLPEDAPTYQKKFMNSLLFSKANIIRLDEIGERPTEYQAVTSTLRDVFTGDRKLTKTNGNLYWYLLLIISSTFTLGTNYAYSSLEFQELFMTGLIWAVPFFVGWSSCSNLQNQKAITSPWKLYGKCILRAGVMAALCWFYIDVFVESEALMTKPFIWALWIACFITNELSYKFKSDTPYRADLMGRILGFREFIETAEKPRLEQLQHDDPQYFYKILPYAMVFELTDKWASLFKGINVERPEWYESAVPLTGYALVSSLTSNLYTANDAIKVISHDSSSDSSSGGGGGGYSGGGGGGGGGGSW